MELINDGSLRIIGCYSIQCILEIITFRNGTFPIKQSVHGDDVGWVNTWRISPPKILKWLITPISKSRIKLGLLSHIKHIRLANNSPVTGPIWVGWSSKYPGYIDQVDQRHFAGRALTHCQIEMIRPGSRDEITRWLQLDSWFLQNYLWQR